MESGNSEYNPAGQSTLSSPPPSPTSLFHNEHGLRPGWRLLVYLLLVLGGGANLPTGGVGKVASRSRAFSCGHFVPSCDNPSVALKSDRALAKSASFS